MYRKLLLVIIAVVFISVFSSKEVSAQQTLEPQITGGYGDASVTSKEVKTAAKHAVLEHNKMSKEVAKLVSIKKAQMQVVAGLNYQMCLKIRVKGKIRNVTVVVYQNLQKVYSLSSWEAEACKM